MNFEDNLLQLGAKVMMVEYFVDGLGETVGTFHDIMGLV